MAVPSVMNQWTVKSPERESRIVKLPNHLAYEESSDDDGAGSTTWFPWVRCKVAGCDWNRQAAWDELAADDDTDWNALHSNH